MDALKNFVAGFLVRWLMKVGGTYFITMGIQEANVTEWVGGALAFVVGIAISIYQHKKALATPVD